MNNLISNKELEKISEKQSVVFLENRKITVTSIPRAKNKNTADYKFTEEFHVENTVFEGYKPQEVDNFFNENKNNFGNGIMIIVGLKEGRITIEKLGEFTCDKNLFLLVVQYSPSALYPKVDRKIGEKYQKQLMIVEKGGIICLDFRVAGIDLCSLSELLNTIMKSEGHNYKKLAGVILLSQFEPQSPKDFPDGVLIVNPYYSFELPEEFRSLLPPKKIDYEMNPYQIEANLLYSETGINNFRIKNIPLPDGKTLYITGISKAPGGLIKVSVENY